MRKIVLVFSFFMIISFPLIGFCNVDTAWVSEVSNRVDEDAVAWLKEKLVQSKAQNENKEQIVKNIVNVPRQCLKNTTSVSDSYQVIIFISLSVPEAIWLQLSEELKKIGGIFVLRGLPNNSFKSLAYHLLNLKRKGIEAPIQIHPQLFKEHGIEKVPAFLVRNEHGFNKLSGNVSLKYALDLFEKEECSKKAQTSNG